MIIKASQRGYGMELARHLLNDRDNDHVEIHQVRGFVSENLAGAMKEAQALSLGTKCKQYLFSVSLNPPTNEDVAVDLFEQVADRIEERMGLQNQPRAIVFHEKEGRRHAHIVWSRIDSETMTAKPLPFFKSSLNEIARNVYLEQGWQMPKGFAKSEERSPLNFTLEEWQQSKRTGLNPKDLKAAVQDSWGLSGKRNSYRNVANYYPCVVFLMLEVSHGQ